MVFRKKLLSKQLWMKEKCESLASLPAPLPSLASICLPLPATGVHTFKQGCMSFIQRAVYLCNVYVWYLLRLKFSRIGVFHELGKKFSDLTEYWAFGGYISNRCASIVTGHTCSTRGSYFQDGYGRSLDFVMLENATFILFPPMPHPLLPILTVTSCTHQPLNRVVYTHGSEGLQ